MTGVSAGEAIASRNKKEAKWVHESQKNLEESQEIIKDGGSRECVR